MNTLGSVRFGQLIDQSRPFNNEQRNTTFQQAKEALQSSSQAEEDDYLVGVTRWKDEVPSQIQALEDLGIDVVVKTGKKDVDGDQMEIVSLELQYTNGQSIADTQQEIRASKLKEDSLKRLLQDAVISYKQKFEIIHRSISVTLRPEVDPDQRRRGCL